MSILQYTSALLALNAWPLFKLVYDKCALQGFYNLSYSLLSAAELQDGIGDAPRRNLGISVSAGDLGGAVNPPKQVQGRALVGVKGAKLH